MDIRYDSYKTFYYVAKYESFTQAANVLRNSQPNITRCIKNLEEELGCKLFIRSNRGTKLTQEGQKLYAHVSLAFEHLRAGEEEILQRQSLKSGNITIAASEIALHCALLPALKRFRSRYPGVRIRIFNHSTPQAIEVLRNGLADFAVVTTPTDAPKSLLSYPIQTIQEVPVCSAAFDSIPAKTLALQELLQYPIICLGAQTKTFQFYTRFFAQNGLTLRPDIEAATADQILPMVKSDLGIGFVPEDFIFKEADPSGIRVLTVKPAIPKREICLLKRKGEGSSVAAKELEKMLLNKGG